MCKPVTIIILDGTDTGSFLRLSLLIAGCINNELSFSVDYVDQDSTIRVTVLGVALNPTELREFACNGILPH